MSEVKNYYPELPQIPYEKTSIPMEKVIEFAKTLKDKYNDQYIRSAYAIFRNESANGARGVNNNYAGIQADNARWTNLPGKPIGTSVKFDSGNEERRFLCFSEEDGFKISFELLCIKCTQRTILTPEDYFRSWVGKKKWNQSEVNNFQSMLNQAKRLI